MQYSSAWIEALIQREAPIHAQSILRQHLAAEAVAASGRPHLWARLRGALRRHRGAEQRHVQPELAAPLPPT